MRQERFTEQAQEALAASQELVRQYHHSQWDVEHILLALLQQQAGLVGDILKGLSVDVESVRQQVVAVLEKSPKVAYETPQIYATPLIARLLESASAEAERLKDEFIGTEHLLIAMAGEQEGEAVGILHRFGIGGFRVCPCSKDGLAGFVAHNTGSLTSQDCALQPFQVVNMGQFVAFDLRVAVAAERDAVGCLKHQFGVFVDRHYMMGVNVPGVAAPDALPAEQPEHRVPPVLVLWSFAKAHKPAPPIQTSRSRFTPRYHREIGVASPRRGEVESEAFGTPGQLPAADRSRRPRPRKDGNHAPTH